MDQYMVQTRAQVKSSSIKLPEVNRARKDLIPHVKPEKSVQSACPIPPTCHLRPIHHIPHTDQRPPTNAMPPVPKPRMGQGRAGIRRKLKVALPITKVIQTPTLPMPMPGPRTVQPLTESVTQSQDSILPQHADKIITLYHTSMFAGHQGVVKTYLTISDMFFIPGLVHYLRSHIKGCHTCQIVRADKPPTRQLKPTIYLNYRPLYRLSMDLKVMPRSQKGHKFILCVIDEVTNYLITFPFFKPDQKKQGKH